MKTNYILSNKENEQNPPKSPIKLKINYQSRESFYERTKSPLRQESINHRANLRSAQEHKTPPLSTKTTDYNRMNFQDYSLQTVSKLVHDNGSSLNTHLKTTPDPSMIKPISLENKKHVDRRAEQRSLAPQTSNSHPLNSIDISYSQSRHRQNSKHLQFCAKVGNLDKINHQISSLLSYIYENKTAPKEQKTKQDSSSYKPRYGLVSENSKPYQRRLEGLEKPKQAEPLVSTFDVEGNENKDLSLQKERRSLSKYNYSNYEDQSKSPYRLLEQSKDKKSVERRTPRHVNKDISPRSKQNSTNSQFDEHIGVLKTVKSQNFSQSLTPSESFQKLSKITTSNNPDLEFYYDSLKKRDEQIENFKQKLIGNQNPSNFKQYCEPNSQSLTEKYKAPFKRRNQPKNIDRQADSSFTKMQSTPQKDVFITKEEVEVYKDINKLSHQERSSVNRLQRIAERRANLEREMRQQINHAKSLTPKNTERESKHDFSYTHEESFANISQQITKIDQRRSLQRKAEPNNLTSKIDQQIQKIKNQLKDCNKQKSYLRQKYSSILSKQTSNFQSKNTSQFQTQDKFFNEPLSQPKRNEAQFNFDRERMFDSENNKRLQSACLKAETQQMIHEELRQKIYSEDRRQVQRAELMQIKKSQIYEQKTDYEVCERAITKQKVAPIQVQYQSQELPQEKQATTNHQGLNANRQQFYQSFGTEVSRKFEKKRATTPKKQFAIQLNKIEITKPQTTRFGTLLAEKIQIDLKLRNQRQKFIKSTNPNKWNDLKSYLENRYNISKNLKQLEQLITISPQQHNPFSPTSMSSNKSNSNNFSKNNLLSSQSTEEIPLLCSFLAESLQFFETRLLHQFSTKKLEKEHFSFKQLDLNSKGYLSLEDLICFVNLHSGKFYRNRDIIFFVKVLSLQQKHKASDNMNGAQCYSSAKGVNEYRLSYEFLWNILTKKD